MKKLLLVLFILLLHKPAHCMFGEDPQDLWPFPQDPWDSPVLEQPAPAVPDDLAPICIPEDSTTTPQDGTQAVSDSHESAPQQDLAPVNPTTLFHAIIQREPYKLPQKRSTPLPKPVTPVATTSIFVDLYHQIMQQSPSQVCQKCRDRIPKEGLAQHIAEHRNSQPYPCPHPACPFSFKTTGMLNAHIRQKHLAQHSFTCEKCGYWTSRKLFFIKHMCKAHGIPTNCL